MFLKKIGAVRFRGGYTGSVCNRCTAFRTEFCRVQNFCGAIRAFHLCDPWVNDRQYLASRRIAWHTLDFVSFLKHKSLFHRIRESRGFSKIIFTTSSSPDSVSMSA